MQDGRIIQSGPRLGVVWW